MSQGSKQVKIRSYHKRYAENPSYFREKAKISQEKIRSRAIIRGVQESEDNRGNFARKIQPNLIWMVSIKYPFSFNLSKNAVWRRGMGGHVFLRQESRKARTDLTLLFRSALRGRKVAHNKLWVRIFVEKPSGKGDAINVVDLVCDAIKDAIDGLDDNWFSLSGLDWAIVKRDPQIYIEIGQESDEDVLACAYCGKLKKIEEFRKNGRDGCRQCRLQ